MQKYIVVGWPESQSLVEQDEFDKHSYLINDDNGISDFGPSAYFVEYDWYKSLDI